MVEHTCYSLEDSTPTIQGTVPKVSPSHSPEIGHSDVLLGQLLLDETCHEPIVYFLCCETKQIPWLEAMLLESHANKPGVCKSLGGYAGGCTMVGKEILI